MKIVQQPQHQAKLQNECFPDLESTYSFEELLDNGALIKVTSWVTREMGFSEGRFRVQVAVTVKLWAVLHRIPKELTFFQTVRGRGHDVLWLGGWALRRARQFGLDHAKYLAVLPTDPDEEDPKLLHAQAGRTADGRPCVVIGLPEEFPLE